MGPSLYVQTIEQLTDTRIDHLAVVDWNGLIGLVDVLGGVTLTFDTETVARGRTWPAGTHTLNGEEVRDYVGERYRLPRGDFDRVERQQNVLRALGVQMIESGTLRDPGKALSVAREATSSSPSTTPLTIPRIVSLALSARGLRPDNVTYLTVPTAGVGFEGSQSVVYLDEAAQDGFWEAFRADDALEEWMDRTASDRRPSAGAAHGTRVTLTSVEACRATRASAVSNVASRTSARTYITSYPRTWSTARTPGPVAGHADASDPRDR